jgi:hypothetical protein
MVSRFSVSLSAMVLAFGCDSVRSGVVLSPDARESRAPMMGHAEVGVDDALPEVAMDAELERDALPMWPEAAPDLRPSPDVIPDALPPAPDTMPDVIVEEDVVTPPDARRADLGPNVLVNPPLPSCSLAWIHAFKPGFGSCGTYYDGHSTVPCSAQCTDMDKSLALKDVPATGCAALGQHSCSDGISDGGQCLGTLGDNQSQIIGPVACFSSHEKCVDHCQGASAY